MFLPSVLSQLHSSHDLLHTSLRMSSTNFASTSLVKTFQALYNEREESTTTDLSVVCQDDSEIPVHSLVLSAR